MLDQMTGPVAVFSGTSGLVTRKSTAIDIIEDAKFATLVMEFPAVDTVPPTMGIDAFEAPTYPATFRLIGVKSFELASGSIMVAFRA